MVAFTILASLIFIIGLILNIFIIAYLSQKLPALKTSFDLVLIDSLISSIIFASLIYVQYILIFYFAPLPYYSNIIFAIIFHIFGGIFLSSVFLTMLLKYLFIYHSEKIMEKSDSTIRWSFLFLRILLTSTSIFLNNFGPYQREPKSFLLLKDPNDERTR